jgi:hypothetical protein
MGASGLAVLVTLGLTAGAPIAGQAINYGHPEEVMAGAAAVGALLLALSGRSALAGLALGLAIASKQWALMAALPVLLAAPRHHIRLLAVAGATVLVPLVPLMAVHVDFAGSQPTATGGTFHGHQIWWPFGVDAPAGLDVPGPLVAPAWLDPIVRPSIVIGSVVLSLLWWVRGGRRRSREDVLLLFALIMLVRCALDPWNVHYYHAAFLLALVAWEVRSGRGMPVLTLVGTAGVWLSFSTYTEHYGYGPFLLYMSWVLPLGAYLTWTLLGRPGNLRRPMVLAGSPAPSGT